MRIVILGVVGLATFLIALVGLPYAIGRLIFRIRNKAITDENRYDPWIVGLLVEMVIVLIIVIGGFIENAMIYF